MGEPLWSAEAILAASGGRLVGAPFLASGVSIDTRTLAKGDLFVALQGARDARAFAPAARAAGAAAMLSLPLEGEDAARPALATVEVEDPLKALEALGAAARRRASGAARCAVTGSVGKTSVTQALAFALKGAAPTHSSVQSYNNHIGVPLTLARMPSDTRFGVFEIGMNHAGEITPLTRLVAPQVAVVTTVGAAHVENFPDGEAGVARAKAEIFEGLGEGGVAVIRGDIPWTGVLEAAARAKGAEVVRFGWSEACQGRLTAIERLGDGARVRATVFGEPVELRLRQTGAHWGLNALAALLAADALGAPRDVILEGLEGFAPLAGRGLVRRLMLLDGEALLMDESYNANPLSMAASLSALGETPARGRKIVALTDMLELGTQGPAAHTALAGLLAEAGVQSAFLAGPLMRRLYDALPQAMRGAWSAAPEGLMGALTSALRDGDVLMVKGSKGSGAYRLVEALTAPPGEGER